MNSSLIWNENKWAVKPNSEYSEKVMNLINTFGTTLPEPKFKIGERIYFHKNFIDMDGVIEIIHLGTQLNDYEEQDFEIDKIYYVVMANAHVRWVTEDMMVAP